jgi:predicted aminopeptidase
MSRAIALAMLALSLGGCANLLYYAQSVVGHAQVMAAARPIGEVIADPSTTPALRTHLEQVQAIRDFASRELALPGNASYRSYADIGRPYVVWNVFAAPEFSLEPVRWCMLIVGCVNYRGYYDEGRAVRYAEELGAQGLDTHVGGVTAYSTLGHFNDPVLETFLRFGDQEAARIIFHELAHQVVFVAGDTAFNESFAVTVEDEGLRRWLTGRGNAEQLREFAARQGRRAQFYRLIADCRERLRGVYASSLPAADMRRAKDETFAELRRAYAEQKAQWNGYAGYDRWFAQPMNNALLASVALYTQWVPAFRALLADEHGDLAAFYKRVAVLAELPQVQRAEALDRLAPAALAAASVLQPDDSADGVELRSGPRTY